MGLKVPANVSYTSHYRERVNLKVPTPAVEDKTIWKFKDELMKNVNRTLEDLQIYFNSD
jgi:hypothetical protein